MRDQFALRVDNVGKTFVADADRGHDIPDELEVDLCNGDAGGSARVCERDRHVRLRAAPKIDGAEPRMHCDGLGEARIGRIVGAACHDVRFEARELQLLFSGAVHLDQLRYRRHLSQQADKVVAALLERNVLPFGARGPAHLAFDIGDEKRDALGRGLRLFLLHAHGGALGFLIA